MEPTRDPYDDSTERLLYAKARECAELRELLTLAGRHIRRTIEPGIRRCSLSPRSKFDAEDSHKSELLALLAHELRNPLAPIRNALEILRRPGRDEHLEKPALDMMQRQVGQMVRLVDDLLGERTT